MTEEIWKPIVGFEGLYEVSNFGRIRSLDTIDSMGRKRRGCVRALQMQTSGYVFIALNKDGVKYPKTVHRLVYHAFNPPLEDGQEVAHNDGDKCNNRATNLVAKTKSENQLQRREHGTANYQHKDSCDRGHPFTNDNITNYAKKCGHKKCLACYRAMIWIRSHDGDLKRLSDLCFQYKTTVGELKKMGIDVLSEG